jgi:hypothetical protein
MQRVLHEGAERHLIHVCCVCGDARDEVHKNPSWRDLRSVISRHGFRDSDVVLSHTFCPPCFMFYKRQIGLDQSKRRVH